MMLRDVNCQQRGKTLAYLVQRLKLLQLSNYFHIQVFAFFNILIHTLWLMYLRTVVRGKSKRVHTPGPTARSV